jgi:hypothetical protein
MNAKKLVVSALGMVLSAAAAHASVAVNFYANDTNYPNQLAPTSIAGVVAQANWNNMTIGNGDGNGHWNGGELDAPVDDSGSTVTAMTIVAGGDTYVHPFDPLGTARSSTQCWATDGAAGQWGGSGTWEVIENGNLRPQPVIDISGIPYVGIPYANYDVFVYISPEGGNGGSGTITITDMSGGQGMVDPIASDGNYSYAWNPNKWVLGCNYVEFAGDTSPDIELFQSSTSWNTGIAAVQIVPVPEPASLALLALGALPLARRRRAARA